MAKVLLVSANVCAQPYPVYPLGMAYVAASLAKLGYEISQFDPLMHDDWGKALAEEVSRFAPDVVGLSMRNIDNVDSLSADDNWWVKTAKSMVETVKAASSAPVIVGGSGFSLLPGPILDYIGADHGIQGEGELAFGEMVETLMAGGKPPNMVSSSNPRLDPSQFITPLYDKGIADYHIERTGMLNLQTKRGCPFICAYCTYPCLEGSTFRQSDPRAVVDEMERLVREYNPTELFFTDSVFNDPKGRYLEVAEEIIRRGLKVDWCGFFRPSGMGIEEIGLMKRSGLFAMELGTDAASDTTLAALDKQFNFEEALAVGEAANQCEVPSAHFVIFGGPGETRDTVEEGLENIARLGKNVVFAFSGIRILPGTTIHKRAVEEGVVEPDNDLLHPVFYFSPEVDGEWMNRRITEAFTGRRDRIFPPEEGQMRMQVMTNFGYKGLLWNKLVDFRKGR